jgi:elongation factor P--(R)-beta-lysine ligase
MPVEDSQRLARLEQNLRRRALIINHIHSFFNQQDFLEVETPLRAPAIAPEPNIAPFPTADWFLAASPELHMKRLLAAGYQRIFQFSHCFRRGERGRWHNPEFTMLEWYRAGADYNQIIEDTEQIVVMLAGRFARPNHMHYAGRPIDLRRPWPRVTVRDAYLKAADWDPVLAPDLSGFDIDFVTKVLPSFDPRRPTVLMDYPASQASLARLKPGDPRVAERAEIFIGGLELANIYSELADAGEQEKRFREDIAQIEREQHRPAPMPRRFIEAMKDFPPCGGVALGIDRLVMLFCDAPSVDDVMAFTEDNA